MDLKFHNGPTVPINELLVPLLTSGVEEPVEYWIRKLGIVVVEDWAGRRSLKPEDARRVVHEYRSAVSVHRGRWSQFQEFLVARRERAAQEKARARAEESARVAAIRDAKQRAQEELNLREREELLRAAEEEKGPDFESWSRSNP